MKQLIITIFAIAALGSCKKSDPEPQAPLVITKADMATNFKPGGAVYTFSKINLTSSTVAAPARGENQSWDFSALAESSISTGGGTAFITPANASFPSATYGFNNTNSWTVSGIASPDFASTDYSEVSDGGYYYLGWSQNATTAISIPSLGATISYPVQNLNFTGTAKYPRIIFPAKYSDSLTTTNLIKTSNYTVTAAAFGLNNTPGQTKVTTASTIVTTASGTANLKGISNVRVLVIKESWQDKTNFFLGGAPTPTALLNMLGVTDGAITTGTYYRFYGEGLGLVGVISVNAAGTVTEAQFRKQ